MKVTHFYLEESCLASAIQNGQGNLGNMGSNKEIQPYAQSYQWTLGSFLCTNLQCKLAQNKMQICWGREQICHTESRKKNTGKFYHIYLLTHIFSFFFSMNAKQFISDFVLLYVPFNLDLNPQSVKFT